MTAFRCLIAAIVLSFSCGARAETAAPPAAVALPTDRAVAAATLRSASVPADRDSDTLLDVQVAGRFSLRAQSATGVSLQLVDMATGPGDISGAPGTRDGRVDALLDKGTYKLRSAGAAGATGQAALSALPFREVDGASTALARGGQFTGTLGDLQQRSYWIAVERGQRVTVEAAGRALQDLRLWSNGSDLVDVEADMTTLEPKAGHPVTRARLEAEVEPGLYLVTAYGGAPLVWADGDGALPFHINTAPPQYLAGGWFEGVIGPSGSARFRLPAAANHVRVELPEVAPARLMLARAKDSPQTAEIAKNNREPVAAIEFSAGENVVAEVTGLEGQPYRMRAIRRASSLRAERPGPHLLSVEVAGEGGDELPATVAFGEFRRGHGGVVLFSNAPRIAQGQAWRRKFNLRGPSTILFEMVDAGPVAARTEGPGVTLALTPLLGNLAPRADGQVPTQWDVQPGWHVLRITPVENAVGILDLTFGTPGVETNAQPASPPRASIALGTHDFLPNATYQVFTNTAPALITGPSLRPLPAEIASTPLALHPGGNDPVEVRIPLDGIVTATGVDGKPIEVRTSNEVADKDRRTVTLTLPEAARDRVVILSWSRNAAPEPLPAPVSAAALPSLKAAQPHFFDLKNNERRRFTLDVAEGGLYRIETLGRLKTALDIATPYLPNLGNAADNGPGHNALLQTYLRAGAYRVNVSASASAGRLALVANPAPLPNAGVLVPGESGRASLIEGRGVVFPIEIAEPGTYRLDLYGLGRIPTARLEDAEGWPITKPGEVSRLDRELAAGRYRLVVLPQATDTRVVARLRRLVPDKPPEGHGPHTIALDTVQKFQWREPAAKDAPRVPDRWEFTLAGPANVVLETSDGMIGDLLKVGDARPVAKVVYKRGFSATLAAGRYAIEMRSLGRNDRLDYELTLRATEIQPGRARFVDLPATIPFAIAADRVVSLTTYGREDMSAILKDKDGRVIERLSGRTDDWNIALSRHLPAGAYQLQLNASGKKARAQQNQPAEGEAAEESDGEPQEKEKGGVEVQLALPEAMPEPELAFAKSVAVTGSQVHQFALPRVDAGDLLLVAAQSSAELVVSLERQDASGRWSAAGFRRGKDVFIAVPADMAAQPWRAAVWAVDGGSARITVAARAVRVPAQPLGAITLAPQALDGIARPIQVALVAVPGSGLVTVARSPGLAEGSKPGRVLSDTEGGILAAQSERLWLAGRDVAQALEIAALPATSGEIALSLAENDSAIIPQTTVSAGRMRVWRAESTFGQPGLSAGRGMGVADGSALASGTERLRIWNADGNEALRLRVATIDLEAKNAASADGEFAALLGSRTAQPVSLRPGAKKIEINLSAGAGALLDGGDRPITVWGGHEAVTRTLEGTWTSVTLLNTAENSAAVSLAIAPAQGDGKVVADKVLKRFFGAAGSLSLRVEARTGDRVVIAGATATFVADSGSVVRGTSLALSGPGELTVDHEAGLVVAWIERGGASPWAVAAARPLVAPQSVKLDGQAMRFSLKQDAPVLLHARTTAPVILSLAQGSGTPEILLYPAGAALHRYVGAGDAELRVYSPHDGPLAGSLELTATPVVRVAEGLGEARAVAPGATALFGFEVSRAGPVGVGIRSEPDRATVRLLDATGKQLGEGVAQLHRLEPGRYLVEARVPANGRTTTIRPAIIGISPPPAGPPPEVTLQYLEMVGLTSPQSR